MGRIEVIPTVQPRLADRLFRSAPIRWRRALAVAVAMAVLHVYCLALIMFFEIDVPAPAVEASEVIDIEHYNLDIAGTADDVPTIIPPPPGFGNTGSGGGIDTSMIIAGGTTRTASTVGMGLSWLARHQAPSGRWGFDDFSSYVGCNCTDCGLEGDTTTATALALLPFLAAGESHLPTARNQRYQHVVGRGLHHILRQQREDGSLGRPISTALAALALCEAYGLTADPNLKQPAQRAASWIASGQHRAGGWSAAGRDTPDLETTAWHVLALKSAQLAGLNVTNATWSGVMQYLDAAGNADGSFYGSREVTPAALHCRILLGWGRRHPAMNRGIAWMTEDAPGNWRESIVTLYHAHQVACYYGREEDHWDSQLRELLSAKQDKGTMRCQKGSWPPADDLAGKNLGRLGTTALALLVLETHSPRWARRNLGAMKDEAIRDAHK